jgi:tetratricopeptide (TPR) repeat protein
VLRLAAQNQGGSLSMTASETTLTRTGMKLGTAGYMSPEQIRGEPLDARTDIFSFGLVLYEMATGGRAFTGETEAILHDAIQHREPTPVRELAPEITPKLEEIVEMCLEKEREKRFQNAAEIRACLEQQSGHFRKTQSKRLTRRFVVAAALVVVFASAVASVLYRRPHPGFKLTDKDTVVLADFQNKTGDPVFDVGLTWALRIALEQTPFLNPLSDDKLNRLLAQTGHSAAWGAPLTLETSRQICSATHSAAVIGASIADAGNQYQIAVKAIRCDTDSLVSDVSMVANDRQLIVRELGKAAVILRKDLGEPAASIREFNQPLEIALTSSPEALKAVLEGRNQESTKGDLSAVQYAERAVELDPSFSFGWQILAGIYANTGKGDPQAAFEKAYALRDRLTKKMRLEIESSYFFYGTEQWDKAVSKTKELTEKYPTSPWNYNNLSVALRNIASYDESATAARETIRQRPDVYPPYYNLIYAEIGMEHYPEAEAAFKEVYSRHLDSGLLRELRFLLSFLERDTAGMDSQLKEGAQSSKSPYTWLARQASAEAYFGHFRRARSSLNHAIAAAKNAGQPEGVAGWEVGQALDETEAGNGGLEIQWVQRSQRQKPDDSLFLLPSLPARLGEIQSARVSADRFSAKYPKAMTWLNLGVPCYSAAVALSQNRPADAIESLQQALPYDMIQDLGLYSAYLRGLAFLQSQQAEKAAAEFQKVIDHPGVVLIHVWGALAHLQLARAYAMMRDTDGARKSYQDFLTLWKDADPDIPIYKQAKAEYAKLNGLPASSRQLAAKH